MSLLGLGVVWTYPPCAAVLALFFNGKNRTVATTAGKPIRSGLSLQHECKKSIGMTFIYIVRFREHLMTIGCNSAQKSQVKGLNELLSQGPGSGIEKFHNLTA